MGSRKKKKKREQKKRGRPPKVKPSFQGVPEGTLVIPSPPGQGKMSEVLLEFIAPYAREWNTEEELKKLLSVAVLGWNAALQTETKREEFLQEMTRAVPPEARPSLRTLLDEMTRRKIALFASNKRIILGFEVTPTPSGPHVSVMSTLEPG